MTEHLCPDCGCPCPEELMYLHSCGFARQLGTATKGKRETRKPQSVLRTFRATWRELFGRGR